MSATLLDMVIIKDIDIFNDEDMLDNISDMSFKTFGFGVLFCIAFAIFVPHETFDDGWCVLRWLIGIGAGLILTFIFHNVLYVCASVCCLRCGVLDAEDDSVSEAPKVPPDFNSLTRGESEDLKNDEQNICFAKHVFVRIVMVPTWVLTCVLIALAFVDYVPLGTCIVGVLHLLGCAIDWAIVRVIESDKNVKYVADTGSGVRLYAEDDDNIPTGRCLVDKKQAHSTGSDHLPEDNESTEMYSGGDEIV